MVIRKENEIANEDGRGNGGRSEGFIRVRVLRLLILLIRINEKLRTTSESNKQENYYTQLLNKLLIPNTS